MAFGATRRGPAAAGCLALVVAGGAVSAGEAPLGRAAGLPVVSVRIGGHGPFELLLDTGSAGTVLDVDLGRELRLVAVDRVLLTTPAGTTARPRADLPALELAGERIEGLRATLADLPGLASTGRPLRGILGQDALRRYDVQLDFRGERLSLNDGCGVEGSEGSRRVRFDEREGILLDAVSDRDRPPLRLLLDSGASGLVLFGSRSAAAYPGPVGSRVLTAADGERRADAVRVGRLEVGGSVLEDLVAALLPGEAERGVDGLLPATLFSSVCVSYSAGYVVLGDVIS